MNAVLRLFIGLIVSTLIFFCVVHFANIPRDKYMPPSAVYDDITASTTGTVTATHERGYGDHWWAGVDYRWYVDYTFTPDVNQNQAGGAAKTVQSPSPISDEIQISESDYDKVYVVGGPITVHYDPDNPTINGVPNTIGHFSKGSGWLSGWLWWPIGFLVLAILIGEAMKKWIKMGDI